jgi:C4-dicarboxylate-specific signal transduction histidine kinase
LIHIDKTKLSISDNAGGIQEHILDKIFEPYFSTKLDKEGTGLGLYMSRIIIQDHCNGKLSVTNNEHGACFTIDLGIKND